MLEFKPKLAPVPPPELPDNEYDFDSLDPYIQVVKGYNTLARAWACDSLPPVTPLDCIENRLFKLFFFDTLEALSDFSDGYQFKVVNLNRVADYVVQSLLHLSGKEDTASVDDEEQQSIASRQRDGTPQTQSSHIQLRASSLPTLPFEVVECILEHLHASITSSRKFVEPTHWDWYTSLTRCALVNRTWHSAALPLFWKNVTLETVLSGYGFMRRILNGCCLPRATQLEQPAWPGTWVVQLKISCLTHQMVWRTLVQNLSSFPNLRRLTLKELRGSEELSLLFDQDLPFLEHLAIHDSMQYGECMSVSRSRDDRPLVDRERARTFLSRLSSVHWGCSVENAYSPAFFDAAHANLRQVFLPAELSDLVARQFLDNCSHTLSVVRLLKAPGPDSRQTFEVLATKCTGLRAFGVGFDEDTDVDGFEYLMKLCGPRLVALHLSDFSHHESINIELVRSVSKHCRSLEYLSMDITAYSESRSAFEDALLSLLGECGQTIRYITLGISYESDSDQEYGGIDPDRGSTGYLYISDTKLIQTIANSCPNLRGLECSRASGEDEKMTKAREEAVRAMLEKCGDLWILDLSFGDGLDEISDPILKGKLESLEGRCGKQNYFRWEFYAARPSASRNNS
ncbi:hypothetical protein HK102_000502 [Quaeritorhiza haematococci]|nr:hypothetical protein HK102_000502 [Quaeritorhiza haematococci]